MEELEFATVAPRPGPHLYIDIYTSSMSWVCPHRNNSNMFLGYWVGWSLPCLVTQSGHGGGIGEATGYVYVYMCISGCVQKPVC